MNFPYKVLVRDLAILGLTLAVWALSRRLNAETTALSIVVAIVAGLLAPLVGFLTHEWGHLIGAWVSRSAVYPSQDPLSVFLFTYDLDKNSREQFLSMSYGGFIASILFVAVLLVLLPMHGIANLVALGVTTIGVIATFILEVPDAWRVYRGGPFPGSGIAFVGGNSTTKAGSDSPPAR